MNQLHFRDIHKRFRQQPILDGVELQLNASCCTLLTGDNGTGKTTLLRILGGFEKPEQFEVDTGFNRLNWRQFRKAMQGSLLYLHQQPFMFEGSVRANLAYALPRDISQAEQQQRIDTALQWAGLERIADAPAKKLSGGECQRVALARGWLRQPSILLLDEPTANMDREARLRTITLLRQLRDEGTTLLMASHDPDYFSSLVDQQLHLQAGKLQRLDDIPQFANRRRSANITPLHPIE